MNTIRKFLFAVPATLLAVTAMAQTPSQTKAKTILDEVSKTSKAYTSISATFSITLTKADKTSDTKTGSVVMKDGKYKITIENKVQNVVKKEEYYNDGKTTWVYSEKDKEVTIDCFDANKKSDNSFSPNDIFYLHEKGFNLDFIEEKTQKDGKIIQVIKLVPQKPEKKNYHQVKVTIDKAKKQIISVMFMNKDGGSTTYTVNTFTPNLAVTDAGFQFDTKSHAGVEVIDLRDCAACPCNTTTPKPGGN